MPDTTQTPEIKLHPAFTRRGLAYYQENEVRMSEVFDLSISETEKFLIPTDSAVWVFDEFGTKHRHYEGDGTLVQVSSGGRSYSSLFFRSKKAAEANGYKFSVRCQCFMKEDDQEIYGNERILSYHSSARTDYTIPEDDWKVGCEVEKEHESLQRDVSVWKLFQETGWAKENDNSLGDGGFELVSPILPLYDRARLKKALRPVKKYLNGQYSGNCGGHINLSCKGKTSKEVLASLKAGAALLYALYQPRMTNRYCHVRQWNQYMNYPDKYSAFFLKSNQVCEIRLFPAVKSDKNLMWRLDLVRWIVSINQNSFVKKILSFDNKNSYLSCHFRQIFSEDKIRKIAQRAIKHYQKWIAPLTVAEKNELEAAGYVVSPDRVSDDAIEDLG
jgi:hypothetical protein